MSRASWLLCSAVVAVSLIGVAACESTSVGVGMSYSTGYYPGYGAYPGYPGYWYDDDRPIVIPPGGNRPDKPTTLPSQLPSTRPMPKAYPSQSMSRPPTRPTPRPMPRRR